MLDLRLRVPGSRLNEVNVLSLEQDTLSAAEELLTGM